MTVVETPSTPPHNDAVEPGTVHAEASGAAATAALLIPSVRLRAGPSYGNAAVAGAATRAFDAPPAHSATSVAAMLPSEKTITLPTPLPQSVHADCQANTAP